MNTGSTAITYRVTVRQIFDCEVKFFFCEQNWRALGRLASITRIVSVAPQGNEDKCEQRSFLSWFLLPQNAHAMHVRCKINEEQTFQFHFY